MQYRFVVWFGIGNLCVERKMTITLTREEAQQVHDALLNFEGDISDAMFDALTTLRARLAQPEPEPVAWHEPGAYGNVTVYKKWAKENKWLPLYSKGV
jgi:hypothetical protein